MLIGRRYRDVPEERAAAATACMRLSCLRFFARTRHSAARRTARFAPTRPACVRQVNRFELCTSRELGTYCVNSSYNHCGNAITDQSSRPPQSSLNPTRSELMPYMPTLFHPTDAVAAADHWSASTPLNVCDVRIDFLPQQCMLLVRRCTTDVTIRMRRSPTAARHFLQ